MNESILATLCLFSLGFCLAVFLKGLDRIIDYDSNWGYIEIGSSIFILLIITICVDSYYYNIDEIKYECITIDNQTVICTDIEKESGTITGKREDDAIVILKEYKVLEN